MIDLHFDVYDREDGSVTVNSLILALTYCRDAGLISGADLVYVDGGMASGYITRPHGRGGAVDIA